MFLAEGWFVSGAAFDFCGRDSWVDRLDVLGRLVRGKAIKLSGSTDFLSKTKGPAGLNIYARTPEEIGLSIVAEIIQESNTPVQ